MALVKENQFFCEKFYSTHYKFINENEYTNYSAIITGGKNF